jgi:dihydrofolate synthase / folylpolyglutamate synthase
MRYEDALGWLYERQRFGIKQGLENMQLLLRELDDPQTSFPAVHVTGSNGKGSVCALADEALRAAGVRTGRYISPHLNSFTERIVVEGKPIPRVDVCLLTEQLLPVVRGLEERDIKPTFFEVVTALAFLYFRRRRIELGVIEVGMGGRWDATNVLNSRSTVITNVSLEHTDRLGSTVAAIAAEKAGIIKADVPLVTRCVGDAYDVVRRRAKELGAPIHFVGAPVATESLQHTRFTLQYYGNPVDIELGMLGRHQAENAALAAAAIERLGDAFAVSAQHLRTGLARARWPGRLEPASKDPLVLLDGAHNPAAAASLRGFLERVVKPRKVHVLFTALRDKNLPGIVRELQPVVDRWVATTAPNERALGASVVRDALAREGVKAEAQEDVVEAIRLLHTDAGSDDVLVITGSLFLVGAARAALLKTETDPPLPHAVSQ